MAVILRKIAELAGVYLSADLCLFNAKPAEKPDARERVWRVICQSGYIPNQDARSLAAQRSHEAPSSSRFRSIRVLKEAI